MADLPQGRWFADYGQFSGWCVRWELGRAYAYLSVDQYGRVRSCSSQWCDPRFGDICLLVNAERGRWGRRYGSRASRERRLLCEQIADYLNAVDPLLVTPVPEMAP